VVFGKVIRGMDVVREIAKYGDLKTGLPKETVTIHDCGLYKRDIIGCYIGEGKWRHWRGGIKE
jgi:cyclophilin family peptidyl-prolyl cis-trans isomerase